MKNGMFIVDADGHALDRDPIYRERLPEDFKYRQWIYPTDAFDRFQNGKIVKGPKTPEDNLRDNDIEGIDLQIIYPTGGLFLSRLRDHDFAIALAQTYNDWLHD